jgi:2-amino-4-hydroxy-6-hydroxymethyldihydropteridine diphosphokinase
VVQAVEEKMGRMRSAEGYADRTLDIDILLYDDMVFSASDLTIPHRAIGQRDFVLAPLVSIDAKVMDPMFDQEFAAVLEALPEEQRTILEVIHGWYEVPVIK